MFQSCLKLIKLLVFVLLLFFAVVPGMVQGLEKDSTVLLPPVDFLATVLSSNYVYLSWSPVESTEKVAGYYIYLNGDRLTRTKKLFYLDQSLLPDNYYRYYITAYDVEGRESEPTPSIQIKTPPLTEGSEVRPVKGTREIVKINESFRLNDFKAVPVLGNDLQSLFITFNTDSPTLANIKYGLDEEMSLGAVQGIKYQNSHSYKIDNLQKNLQYYLEIKLKTVSEVEFPIYKISIDGRIFGFYERPGDVLDLSLQARNNSGALISWRNQRGSLQDTVYVVRSDKFYPVNRFSGLPLWSGQGKEYLDQKLEVDKNYYYGIFVCNHENVCSPGSYAVFYLNSQNKNEAISAITTSSLIRRNCQRRNVFTGEKFLISTIVKEDDKKLRMCLAQLIKDDQVINSYQLFKGAGDNFETSLLSIPNPGFYRYEIECYDIFGSDLRNFGCGELVVVETDKEKQGGTWGLNLFVAWLSKIIK